MDFQPTALKPGIFYTCWTSERTCFPPRLLKDRLLNHPGVAKTSLGELGYSWELELLIKWRVYSSDAPILFTLGQPASEGQFSGMFKENET